MESILVVAILVHFLSIVRSIIYLKTPSARSAEMNLVSGISVASIGFISLQAISVARFSDSSCVPSTLIHSLWAGFSLLNGVLYLSIISLFRQNRGERRHNHNSGEKDESKTVH